ncbi:MAG: tetratricopeptide repeat protein [Bacteroidetes bacterium]|nr:tetratricopeptide repeat protein [Bacteroidota bacterium]
MKTSLLLTYALLVVFSITTAQPAKRAQKRMKLGDYTSAVKMLEREALNPENRNNVIPLLAECYRMLDQPAKAQKWYALAVGLPGATPEWIYSYAQVLRTTGDYKKSREMFVRYTQLRPDDPRGNMNIASCDFIINPKNLIIPAYQVKAVKNINSSQSDFSPVFYKDELVFASDRNLNLYDNSCNWEGRGYFDILNTHPKEPLKFSDQMKSAKLVSGKFVKSYHDGPVVFDGESRAYFTRTYTNKSGRGGNVTNHLEIYYSDMSEGKWGPLQPFFLNTKKYSVGFPTISADGLTMVFASDMPGGNGGTDLYCCRWENGKWSQPVNLGPEINTAGNEVFPSLQSDGSLLFSSDGLPGYGSLDIFCSKTGNDGWIKPENLGSPINSSYDDFSMNYAPNSSNGFFTSNRPGGMGSNDIYAFSRIDFGDQFVNNKVEVGKP